jgi:hypothetical protein
MRRGRDADGGFEDGHYDDRDDEGAGGRRRAPSSLNNNNNNNNSEETTTSGTVYLTHQGWMCKRSPAFHKKWQRRWFELRGNVLVYFRDVKVPLSLSCACAVMRVVSCVDVRVCNKLTTNGRYTGQVGGVWIDHAQQPLRGGRRPGQRVCAQDDEEDLHPPGTLLPTFCLPWPSPRTTHTCCVVITQAPTEKEKTDWMNILQRAKQLPEP